MPDGKPAGVRCIQLTVENRCAIFGSALRPACCAGLQASPSMCSDTRQDALAILHRLEVLTRPDNWSNR
jgi:hypothetical protein